VSRTDEPIERLTAALNETTKERDRYKAALEKIASQDYRGNRPPSAGIAWRALHPAEQ
jgi:hypothetical protein